MTTNTNWYTRLPLYIRIIIALFIGLSLGIAMHAAGASTSAIALPGLVSGIILRLMGALAPPLILIAILDTLIKAQLAGGVVPRMIYLLVADVIRPGARTARAGGAE